MNVIILILIKLHKMLYLLNGVSLVVDLVNDITDYLSI